MSQFFKSLKEILTPAPAGFWRRLRERMKRVLDGLTSDILAATISEFQSQTEADKDDSVAQILRLMTESGFVDLLQSMTDVVMQSQQNTRRLLIRSFCIQYFLFGFSAARAIDGAKSLQSLVKSD